MRNTSIIATMAGLSFAAVASAGFDASSVVSDWTTAMSALPVNYTDPGSIANTTGSGTSYAGGQGWEMFTLTTVGGASGAIGLTGTPGAISSISIAASTVAPYTIFEFDFIGNEVFWGPQGSNGIYGVLFNMAFDPTTANVGISVNGGAVETVAASSGYIGVWATVTGTRIDKVLFYLSSGQDVSITGFTVGVIPAPGAVALLGVAGLVGGRRRR